MTIPELEPIGSSDVFRAFLAELRVLAASDASILIQGESGSGKGLAARKLHEWSARCARPLVEVHLAAMAPSLLEAELFGHERGAFTGADVARVGCFQRAEGGTLVLDDIGLLPLEAQVKLLRVLQEREIEPLGSEAPIAIDARVLATTSLDLERAVSKGEFRQDLYYRLAVVPIVVPPLRARPDDVRALTEALVARLSKRLKLPQREFSSAALDRLERHPWPGNVRELENVVERVLVLAESEGGAPAPVAVAELDFLDEAVSGVEDDLARRALAHGIDMEALNRAMMEQALIEQRGNVSAAARRVGLTRRAFEYRQARPNDSDESEPGKGQPGLANGGGESEGKA